LEDRLILTSLSSWLDITIKKWRSRRRILFHDDGTIPASVLSSGNLILHVDTPRKLLTLMDATTTSFIEAAMERPKPPYLIIIAAEEETNLLSDIHPGYLYMEEYVLIP
jgi:hypothetical protein